MAARLSQIAALSCRDAGNPRAVRSLFRPSVGAVGRGARCCGFVAVAPNRLLSGRADRAVRGAATGGSASRSRRSASLLLATALAPPRRVAASRRRAACRARCCCCVLAASGQAAGIAGDVGAGAGPGIARRRRSGSCAGAAALAIIDALQRAGAGTGERLAVAADRRRRVRGHGAGRRCSTRCRWPANTATREASFAAALIRHVELVAASVGAALLIGFPLGVVAVAGAGIGRGRCSRC